MSAENPTPNTEIFQGNSWNLPTDMDIVAGATAELRVRLNRAGWGEDDTDTLEVGFREALNNAIIHGNVGVTAGDKREKESWQEAAQRIIEASSITKKVYVSLDITPERVTITVRDEGKGFNPEKVTDPTQEDAILKPQGRGILFMRSYYDSITYNEIGNEVTMIKTKPQADAVPTS